MLLSFFYMKRIELNQVSPPTGFVTLIFTDVQGSTGLWEKSSDIMRASLGIHDQIMRETLEVMRGYEVKTEGDAFMVAFCDPVKALHWCLTVQERIINAEWPTELIESIDASEVIGTHGRRIFYGLRVRMGVHSGFPECKPDPQTGRMDYFGPMVNRSARIGGAAHGGQILISGLVWDRISPHLSDIGSPVTEDLGEHRLKGLESTERLVAILPSSLSERRFPPPKTLNPILTNLLPSASSFIGREKEIFEIDGLISRNVRLITLTGMGGMGKTRLANNYGTTRLKDFSNRGEGGVWFCDVSEAITVSEICEMVGRSLQVPLFSEKSEETLIRRLGSAIAERGKILLIIDNFEQVVQHASRTISQWIKLAPFAVFLVTSREALRLHGEVVKELFPLSLPEGESDLSKSSAVRLFMERAEAVRPGCVATMEDMSNVGKIVQRLDGIPLAIELAAPRISIFSLEDLMARLSRHFGMLVSAVRDSPNRHLTLRKAIDWSWDLLEPWEQSAGAQCSVFRSGFDLEAAENILDVSSFPQAPPVFEIVQALRVKSIVRSFESEENPGRIRFGMYVTVQEYAREKLQNLPQKNSAHCRHADYYVKLGRLLAPRFPGGGGDKRLRQLSLEEENLRAVHKWALTRMPPTRESANLALEAVLALDSLFTTRGPFQAREEFLDSAMKTASETGADPGLLAWACEARGRAFLVAGFPPKSEEIYEKGLVFARQSGDKKAEAFLMRNIGLKKMFSGKQMEEAREKYESALSLLTEIGDKTCVASLLGDFGCYWLARRDLERAVEFLDKSRLANREVGNQLLEGLSLTNLGIIYQEMGRFDQAENAFLQAISLGKELYDRRLQGFSLGYLGFLFQEEGRFVEAINSFREAINSCNEIGELSYHGFYLAALGSCLACNGSFSEADSIFSSLNTMRQETISPPFAQTEKLHFGLYEACRAGHFARMGLVEKAIISAKRARSIFREAKKGSLESEDVRFALRLLTKAIKALPKLSDPGIPSSPQK
ncbi:tetratricopeptide repeat protein [bacterium]|nr:tetratricopeptide repeat protein [bacterium]